MTAAGTTPVPAADCCTAAPSKAAVSWLDACPRAGAVAAEPRGRITGDDAPDGDRGHRDRANDIGGLDGKTGTAEYGDNTHSHGWSAGIVGDIAFATLVVSGDESAPAVQVSGDFLIAGPCRLTPLLRAVGLPEAAPTPAHAARLLA
jgi:hypothetical protein